MAAVRNLVPAASTSATSADIARSDFFLRNQYYTRELPRPSFTKYEEVRAGINRSVRSLAWSCDGKWVAVGMDAGEIKVYESRSTFESKGSISLAQEHPAHVSTMAFSPVDPDILVSGCKQNKAEYHRVVVWNIKRPKEPIASFKITGDVLHVAFHPSGRHFAAVCPRNGYDEVSFYHQTDNEDGKLVWKERSDIALGESATQTAYEEINSLRFHHSGKAVCAVSNEGSVNAWKFPEAPRPLSPEVPSADIAEETIDAEDATASRASTPREATAPAEIEEDRDAEMAGGENEGETVAETADAELDEGEPEEGQEKGEAVGDSEEATEGVKEGEETKAHGEAVHTGDVDMAVDGETAAEEPSEVKVDAPAEEAPVGTPKPEAEDVEMADSKATVPAPSVAPSRHPSPKNGRKPEPAKKRAGQLQKIRHVMFNPASLLVLAFDPLGRYTAVAGQDALVRLLDSKNWICERAFSHCSGAIRQLAFSPDGELLAVGGDEGVVCIISIHSGELVARYDTKASINALCWHPKKNWLAWSSFASKALVWYVVRQEDGR